MYRIIEQNEDFIVIDKAPGVSVHKDQLDTGLVMQLQQDLNLPELSPVHRLDKVTSGLMLLACHSESASELSALFRNRQVDKFYLALSDKKPRKKQGLVKGDMTKARRGAWKLLKSTENPAKTQFFSVSAKPGIRVFLLKPLTGKTHQIRVAMKSIAAPILGDELYHTQQDGTDRTYLHAYGLGFEYQGQRREFLCSPEQGNHFNDPDIQVTISEHYASPWKIEWPATGK